MKTCTKCKEDKPLSEYYAQNKYSEKRGEYVYYQPYCKDCSSKKAKKWCDDNPEITKASKRKYNKSPKGRPKLAANAKRQKENGDYEKWKKNNPSYFSDYSRMRSEHKKHEITNDEWKDCKSYFNDSCAYCGLHINEHLIVYAGELKNTDLHKEHVIHYGSNKLDNCVPSCQKCNSSKWAKEFDDFYNESNPIFSWERLKKIIKWLENVHKQYMESH